MAALDFPASPIDAQVFQAPNGTAYRWSASGQRWVVGPLNFSGSYLPLSGGAMSGDIALVRDADAAMEPVSLQQMQASGMSAEDNLLVNGGFDVWQRGTSWGGVTVPTKIADRWVVTPGAGSTLNTNIDVAAPGDATSPTGNPRWQGIAIQRTVTGTSPVWLEQRIENVKTANGQTITVSFDVACTMTGTNILPVTFNQNFGTGGSPSSVVTGAYTYFSINAGSTWEHKSLTYAIPSISGKTLGTNNDHSLSFFIGLPQGLGNQTLWVTNVDVRFGSVAPTKFLRRPIQEELALCQRYYQKHGTVLCSGYAGSGIGVLIDVQYPVQMRATPSVALSNINYANNMNGFTVGSVYVDHCHMYAAITTTGYGYATADVALDAEL